MLLLLTAAALAKAPCDPDGLVKVRDALTQVEAEWGSLIAARGLFEECALPPKLGQALEQWSGGMPDTRRMVDVRAAEDILLWNAACKGGVDALLQTMREHPEDQQRAELWTACDLGRSGWITEREFLGTKGALVSGIMTLHWLQQDGIDAQVAKPIARALIGIPDPNAKKPEPLPTFR